MGQRAGEMTIDELAARVGMTVRNVRAYATRGLMAAPRLVGRRGYYNEDHVARLALIRDLIERGYTLNAVEKALQDNPGVSETHALDMLTLLTRPAGESAEPEEMAIAALAELAGVEADPVFIDSLAERGLLERLDGDRVRLLRPVLVRAGSQALRMGLTQEGVLGLFDEAHQLLQTFARQAVDTYRRDVWQGFLSRGMPEEEWPTVIGSVEGLLPVVSQAVVATFRFELNRAIEDALGEELGALTGQEAQRLFGAGAEE